MTGDIFCLNVILNQFILFCELPESSASRVRDDLKVLLMAYSVPVSFILVFLCFFSGAMTVKFPTSTISPMFDASDEALAGNAGSSQL